MPAFILSLDILSPFILPLDIVPGFILSLLILSLLILPAVILPADILTFPILSIFILSWARDGRAREPQIITVAAPSDKIRLILQVISFGLSELLPRTSTS